MKRRGKALFVEDGVLVVDKPEGPTSHDVVASLRRRFKPAKLGHAGTLDPFASGVLLLAFNQATRLMEIWGAGEKVYRGVLALGRATDTGDPTGATVEEAPVPDLERAAVEAALQSLVGQRMQSPPAYSAAKHQGRPLYSYARAGQEVQKPPRPITVHGAVLHKVEPGLVEFELTCSRGTYVRSLAEDLARELGSVGHLSALRRLASRPFEVAEGLKLDEALDLEPGDLAGSMLDISSALARCGLPAVEVDDDKAWQLRQGRILRPEELAGPRTENKPGPAFRVLDAQGGLVAVLRWLEPGAGKAGRSYENIRVFPERPHGRDGHPASASAMGAE
jgi:tRNA pseudouridine55 synthase